MYHSTYIKKIIKVCHGSVCEKWSNFQTLEIMAKRPEAAKKNQQNIQFYNQV